MTRLGKRGDGHSHVSGGASNGRVFLGSTDQGGVGGGGSSAPPSSLPGLSSSSPAALPRLFSHSAAATDAREQGDSEMTLALM